MLHRIVEVILLNDLRYRISDLHQLKYALSNNSRDLKIVVSDFIQDDRLGGIRIQVVHHQFGVLYACVVNAYGSMVSMLDDDRSRKEIDNLLYELKKYGFIIMYKPQKNLPSNQIEYLISLNKLGFDKIRILNVYHYENGIKQFRWYVVAFNVDLVSDWINNAYSPSYDEFSSALESGGAINISALSDTHRWSWDWLDFVGDIDDILKDNA